VRLLSIDVPVICAPFAPEASRADAGQLRAVVRAAARDGNLDDLLPFTGRSAALAHGIAPAQAIVERLVAEGRGGTAPAYGWSRP
jgi:hypothetical protein